MCERRDALFRTDSVDSLSAVIPNVGAGALIAAALPIFR